MIDNMVPSGISYSRSESAANSFFLDGRFTWTASLRIQTSRIYYSLNRGTRTNGSKNSEPERRQGTLSFRRRFFLFRFFAWQIEMRRIHGISRVIWMRSWNFVMDSVLSYSKLCCISRKSTCVIRKWLLKTVTCNSTLASDKWTSARLEHSTSTEIWIRNCSRCEFVCRALDRLLIRAPKTVFLSLVFVLCVDCVYGCSASIFVCLFVSMYLCCVSSSFFLILRWFFSFIFPQFSMFFNDLIYLSEISFVSLFNSYIKIFYLKVVYFFIRCCFSFFEK